jgi:hypothetical protein
MNLYELLTPQQMRAGFISDDGIKKPFYFDCGYCHSKEPVIHGFYGDTPSQIGIVKPKPGEYFFRQALLCKECFALQTQELNAVETFTPSA